MATNVAQDRLGDLFVREGLVSETQLQEGLKEAKDTRDYGIRGTPSLVVAGKYLVSANESVPTHGEMIKIVQYLVEQEHQAAEQAVASNE